MHRIRGQILQIIVRGINWHLVTLAGGLSVALSAAVLMSSLEQDVPARAVVVRAASPLITASLAPIVHATSEPGLTYILVGSQAEAFALEAVISTDAASITASTGHVVKDIVEVVVLETVEQESEFRTQLRIAEPEYLAADPSVHIVDLRN
jgi:hypothetical protein